MLYNNFIALKCVICLVLAVVLSCFMSIKALAQDPDVNFEPTAIMQSGPVTIIWKNKVSICIEKERYFLVTKETTIVDKTVAPKDDGNIDSKEVEISIDRLPVPCEATIDYRMGKGRYPECVKIVVEQRIKKRK